MVCSQSAGHNLHLLHPADHTGSQVAGRRSQWAEHKRAGPAAVGVGLAAAGKLHAGHKMTVGRNYFAGSAGSRRSVGAAGSMSSGRRRTVAGCWHRNCRRKARHDVIKVPLLMLIKPI